MGKEVTSVFQEVIMFYRDLKERFMALLGDRGLEREEVVIETRILKAQEAIGTPQRRDFPLLKGKEVMMEATFLGARGQAYTDAPSEFRGALEEVVRLPLDSSRERALFIAAMNAVMRYLNPDLLTVHCRDEEPEECAREMASFVKGLNPSRVGLIGLQPAILENLVKLFGPGRVLCADRDEEKRGSVKFGVPLVWGDEEGLERIMKESEVVLATGSTVVNGSIVEILDSARRHGVGLYFYGVTIAGTAELMGLQRLCFRAH